MIFSHRLSVFAERHPVASWMILLMWFSPEAFSCENHIGFQDDPKLKFISSVEIVQIHHQPVRNLRMKYPPRETITYPTLGKGKSSSKVPLERIFQMNLKSYQNNAQRWLHPRVSSTNPELDFQTMPTVNDQKKPLPACNQIACHAHLFPRHESRQRPPPSLRNAEVTPETLSHQGSRIPDLRIYLNLQYTLFWLYPIYIWRYVQFFLNIS